MVDTKTMFNHHRLLALGLLIIGSVLWWYALILITNPVDEKPIPNTLQFWGLGFGLIMAIVGWCEKCFTVKPT